MPRLHLADTAWHVCFFVVSTGAGAMINTYKPRQGSQCLFKIRSVTWLQTSAGSAHGRHDDANSSSE